MKFDVAIIGASVAGSTAAYALGKAGARVALIDKARFPRRKPCGEGLSQKGIEAFVRVGLGNILSELPSHSFSGFKLHSGKRSVLVRPPSHTGRAIQRLVLDEAIFREATSLSNITYINAEAKCVLPVSGTIRIASMEIDSNFIVIADGANSRSARALKLRSFQNGGEQSGVSLTYQGRYFGDPPSFVNIFIENGFEVYCTPLAHGQLTICFLARNAAAENMRSLWEDKALLSRVFANLAFEGELVLPPVGRSPLRNIRRESHFPNIFLIGDAAEEFDPIGGMGMTHAVQSGELVARSIGQAYATKSRILEYEQSRRRIGRPLRFFTHLCAKVLRSSRTFPSLLNVAASPFGNFITQAALKD